MSDDGERETKPFKFVTGKHQISNLQSLIRMHDVLIAIVAGTNRPIDLLWIYLSSPSPFQPMF
jgi:hypothetical protein